MSGIFGVVFLLVLCFLYSLADTDDCPYKECLCTSDDIACQDLQLTSVPPRVTNENRFSPSLHLENNQITTIPGESLPPNLTDIYLMNNPILTIDDSAFNESTLTLATVAFSNAQFTRIPNAFLLVKNLIRLTMSDCNIVDWNTDVMKHIGPTTMTMTLDNVGLTTWPDWIQYFSLLTELNIVNNAIAAIPDDGLVSLAKSVTSLSLYSNAFISVPKALTQLTSIQMLYLQGNQISDLTWLSHLNELFTLNLANNQISHASNLSQGLRSSGATLFDLDLNHNQLSEIPDLSFLNGVTSLDLSYNQISDANSGSLPSNLFSLDLDNNLLPSFPRIVSGLIYISDFIVNTNSIQELHGTDFPPSVQHVVLAYNLITELNETSFPLNSNIQNLNINDNPITRVSPDAFNNLRHLTVLDIRKTKLTRLPLAMASLTMLFMFDISGTYGLVCTCSEKSLNKVILSMKQENVKGKCGLTSIYTFYDTLSPECP